jgi:hypothetical protein
VNPIEVLDSTGLQQIGYIVPFKEKLKNLLSIPEATQNQYHHESIAKNINTELNDGEFVRNAIQFHKSQRPLYETYEPSISNSDNTLCFALYYDDVEVVNPIGSSTKKHKIGDLNLNLLYCC